MGDPKKQRRKYVRPKIRWNKERIEEENIVLKEYGLKNKTDIYRANSLLKKYHSESKRLIADRSKQGEVEKKQLLDKLANLGLLESATELSNVLGITLSNILERRLQTLVFRKKLAKTAKQARQFIVHRHITVNGEKVTSPSYLVSRKEEDTIAFSQSSGLSDTQHPERVIDEKKQKEKLAKEKKEKSKRKNQRQRRPRKRE